MPTARGSSASRPIRLTRKAVALSCLVFAATTAASSLAMGSSLTWSWPVPGDLQWLPLIGGGLPVLAMLLSLAGLFGARTPAPVTIDAGTAGQLATGVLDLKAMARQFDESLSAQRDFLAMLRRAGEAATRDAAGASLLIAEAAKAAVAAQTRLSTGVERLEHASDALLAQNQAPAPAIPAPVTPEPAPPQPATAEAAPPDPAALDAMAARLAQELGQQIEQTIPDIARLLANHLDAASEAGQQIAATRLDAQVDAAIMRLQGSIDGAAQTIAHLDDVSRTLRDDAGALDTAGRRIAQSGDVLLASATASLAELPAAAASLKAVAETAIQTVAEAAAMLSGDSAALDAAGRETAEAATGLLREAEAMRAAGQVITNADRAALSGLVEDIDAAIARLGAAAARTDETSQDLSQLTHVSARMESVAATLVSATGQWEAAGQRVAAAGESVIERMAGTASRNEAAARVFPALAGDFNVVLHALGNAADALSRTQAGIGLIDIAGLAHVTQTLGAMAASLPAAIEANLITALPACLADTTQRLEAATPRLEKLELLTDRLDNLAQRLPAELSARMRQGIPPSLPQAALQLETVLPKLEQLDLVSRRLEDAAHTYANSIAHAGPAIPADTAKRLESALPRLDHINTLGLRLEKLVAHLPAEMAGGLERLLAAVVPATAERLAATQPKLEHLDAISQRLEAMAGRLPSDLANRLKAAIPPNLPDTAARLEAVTPRLDRLDSVSLRLESLVNRLPHEVAARIPKGLPEAAERLHATGLRFETLVNGLPHEEVQKAAMANMAAATRAIGNAVGRVETALDGQDGALESMIAAIDALRATARDIEASRPHRPGAWADQPEVLSATLIHLDQMMIRSEQVLSQAEALAEAVMDGRSPDVSATLAARTPSLLAGLEAAARRMRSTATALAIASDGPSGPQAATAWPVSVSVRDFA